MGINDEYFARTISGLGSICIGTIAGGLSLATFEAYSKTAEFFAEGDMVKGLVALMGSSALALVDLLAIYTTYEAGKYAITGYYD